MTDSTLLFKGACPACGSSDANAHYDDGHTHCFSCGKTVQDAGGVAVPASRKPMSKELIPPGEPQALAKRKLTDKTCAKYRYTVSTMNGQPVQVANYTDESGAIVAQKVRFPNKDFKFLGDTKSAGLYGQHVWKEGGKRVIIAEGEVDALSISQALGNKWPVVSVPNGAQGAAKSLAKASAWLESFDEIVLAFDNDDAGRTAAAECADLFSPGKVRILTYPHDVKDASDMVMADRSEELVRLTWEARVYRPDGVVKVADFIEKALRPPTRDLHWFLPTLDRTLFGRRYGECVALGAGTGIGKTDFITEQIAHDLSHGHQVGVFMLEQVPAETAKRVAGKIANRRFHVPDGSWKQEELEASLKLLDDLFLYDNFGACDWDVIARTIRYLNKQHGVRIFYLDHLTALAAQAEDERVYLEKTMAELGSLVKELDIWLLFVSHLATPDGKPHEEGGRVTIRHFKGSRSIGYWSVFMLGMERDQQAEDEAERHITTLRILKDRLTGQGNGKTIKVSYDPETGRQSEVQDASTYGF